MKCTENDFRYKRAVLLAELEDSPADEGKLLELGRTVRDQAQHLKQIARETKNDLSE